MKLGEVVGLLDAELNLGAFQDVSHNGLQVANSGSVSRICCGVAEVQKSQSCGCLPSSASRTQPPTAQASKPPLSSSCITFSASAGTI